VYLRTVARSTSENVPPRQILLRLVAGSHKSAVAEAQSRMGTGFTT
jgi:hypothetical protein